MIRAFESQEFICSSVGGYAWLLSCSTNSEKVIELPPGSFGLSGVSMFSSVDKASLLYAFTGGRVKIAKEKIV